MNIYINITNYIKTNNCLQECDSSFSLTAFREAHCLNSGDILFQSLAPLKAKDR